MISETPWRHCSGEWTVSSHRRQSSDTYVIPLIDVSFGVGAGAFAGNKKDNGGGGMGGKMNPSAVLVISNGTTKLIDVKSNDGLGKLLDMVPDVINKLTKREGEGESVGHFMENVQNNLRSVKEKAARPAEKTDPYDSESEAEDQL